MSEIITHLEFYVIDECLLNAAWRDWPAEKINQNSVQISSLDIDILSMMGERK